MEKNKDFNLFQKSKQNIVDNDPLNCDSFQSEIFLHESFLSLNLKNINLASAT